MCGRCEPLGRSLGGRSGATSGTASRISLDGDRYGPVQLVRLRSRWSGATSCTASRSSCDGDRTVWRSSRNGDRVVAHRSIRSTAWRSTDDRDGTGGPSSDSRRSGCAHADRLARAISDWVCGCRHGGRVSVKSGCCAGGCVRFCLGLRGCRRWRCVGGRLAASWVGAYSLRPVWRR